jgi:hypothetical protein
MVVHPLITKNSHYQQSKIVVLVLLRTSKINCSRIHHQSWAVKIVLLLN